MVRSYAIPASRMQNVEQLSASLRKQKKDYKWTPFKKIGERWKTFGRDPTYQNFWEAFKSTLMFKARKDYKEARQERQATLHMLASAMADESARNPAFRTAMKAHFDAGRTYLGVDKKGKPFLSTWSGKYFETPATSGSYGVSEYRSWKRKRGTRINMKQLFGQTKPAYESIKEGTSNVQARLWGKDFVVFKEGSPGGAARAERRVNLWEVANHTATAVAGDKMRVVLTMEDGTRNTFEVPKKMWNAMKGVIETKN